MKAAILTAPNELCLRIEEDPKPEEGDVLIRVRTATICGTDIRIFRGRKTAGIRYPSIIGHEFAGEIIDAGGNASLSVGDRVGLCPFISCGRCRLCKSGRENLCARGVAVGYEIDGAFAEIIRIPSRAITAGNLRKLPDDMSFDQAALVEPFSCVLNGQNKVSISCDDTVVVLGAGPIGLMHIRLARLRGAARIIASDPNSRRRDAALAAGADAAIDPDCEDVATRVTIETGGHGSDVVICAVGVPALAQQAIDIAGFGGRISLFAGFSADLRVEMDVNAIHYRELTVTGAFGLSRNDYDQAFDMIASGRFDAEGMITHRFALDDIRQAFAIAESGEAIKVAIQDG